MYPLAKALPIIVTLN